MHTRVLLPVGRGHLSETRREGVASADSQRARAGDGVTPEAGDGCRGETRRRLRAQGHGIGLCDTDRALLGGTGAS